MFGIFKRKHSKLLNGYTHWDIHALARELDPEAWAVFDALPNPLTEGHGAGRPKDYVWCDEVKPSFNTAIKVLLAGYKAPWGHLWSNEELEAHIGRKNCPHCGRKVK